MNFTSIAAVATAIPPTVLRGIEGFTLCKHINVAAVAILAYDYLLTLPDEIEYIWHGRWSPITLLFFTTRYLPFGDSPALLLHHFANKPATLLCSVSITVQSWSFLVGVSLSEIVLILRTTAIWGSSKPIAIFLSALLVATTIPSVYFVNRYANSIKFVPSPASVVDGCFLGAADNVLFVFYVGLQVFETVVFLLTLWKAGSYLKGSFYRELYRDSVTFYAYLFTISLINTIVFFLTASPCRGGILTGLHRIIHAVLSGRIILNIRKAAARRLVTYSDSIAEPTPTLIYGEDSTGITSSFAPSVPISVPMVPTYRGRMPRASLVPSL